MNKRLMVGLVCLLLSVGDQFDLGYMYAEGMGVPKNDVEAVKKYRLAAEQGYAFAQHNLGLMYHDGKGVAQNYILAHKWWNLAAAAGNDKSRHNRDLLAKQMRPAQIAEAQRLAAG